MCDEQVLLKKQMMKEGKCEVELFPNVQEYFLELACDFCTRHPEEAERQRLNKRWESLPSKFKFRKMCDILNASRAFTKSVY